MPNLNDNFIKSLIVPEKGYKIYWDERLVGLGLRITNKKVKSFVLRYVIKGRERIYTIGGYPELTSMSARDIATKIKGKIIEGFDPLEERITTHSLSTLKEMADEYLKICKKTARPKVLVNYEILLRKYILPRFGNYKIDSVTKKDITTFHLSLRETPHNANRILQLLSPIFNLAINWNLININPVRGIKKFKEEKRYRYLSEEEMKKLMEILDKETNKMNVNIIKLILLTGSRKSEVLSARWEDFDLKNGMWVKPAFLTKQNKASHIPISPEVINMLTKMEQNINPKTIKEDDQIISNETYLFYNLKTHTHVKDIKRFWNSVSKKAGLKDARIHDLRHTFASTLVNNGVGLEVIGKLVGHSNIATTQRYAHLINDTLKQATNIFGSKLSKLSKQ